MSGDTWVPYLPDKDHPLHDKFKLLRVQSIGRDYDEQANALQALHEKTGDDVFVAKYTVLQHKETGIIHTRCAWTEGMRTLLPRTDEVAFIRLKGQEDLEFAGNVGWDKMQQVVGDLLRPMEMYPEALYRVEAFPDP